jgi:peptide deformylase
LTKWNEIKEKGKERIPFAKVQVERPKKIKVRSLDEINNKRRTKKKPKKSYPQP